MKKNILTLFLFFGGILFSVGASGADTAGINDKVKFDLLRRLSHTQVGDTARFQLYIDLSRTVGNTETELYYIGKLLQEAQETQNNEYICRAYLARMVLAYNTFDVDGVNKWYNMLEPIARKEKLYDLLFRGRRGMIDMLNSTAEYEREEKESLNMLEEARALNNDVGMIAAYQCLSHAYRSTFREKEAAEVLEKGYDIAYRIKDDSFILEINNQLIATYQTLRDQPNILKWTKSLDRYLKESISKAPSLEGELRGWILIAYLGYLSYYTEEGDLPQAHTYLKLAEKYNMVGYGAYENYYRLARYSYFKKAGEYKHALAEIDVLIKLYKEISPIAYEAMNFQKASLLEIVGELDNALSLYKRSFSMIDSIQVVALNRQTEQLKKDYDTDQLLLHTENMRSNIQLLFLMLFVIVVLILISFVIHGHRVRAELQKSEEEMRCMADEMEQANVAKELFLSTISNSISIPLNSVVGGSLKLVSDEVHDVVERKAISRQVNETSARLLKLVNNILDLSRLEAGMMKFKREELEILPFVKEVVAYAASNGKVIEARYPMVEATLKVNVDIARLQEVFNSIQEGGTTFSLSMEVMENPLSVHIRISGSLLSVLSPAPSQEVVIANEVNRLLIGCWGGKYTVETMDDESLVCLVLPLDLKQ